MHAKSLVRSCHQINLNKPLLIVITIVIYRRTHSLLIECTTETRERKSRTGEEARERERERLRGKRWEERAGLGWRADTGASIHLPKHLLGRKKLWSCHGAAHYLQMGKLSPREGRTYWGYLQGWYNSRVWGLVLCWEHDRHDRHYLNASSLSHCHYPTVQASNMPGGFWLLLVADLGSDYNRSHPWVYALNQDGAEGPCSSGRVSSLKASYRADNRSCCLSSANCVLDIVPFVCINSLDSTILWDWYFYYPHLTARKLRLRQMNIPCVWGHQGRVWTGTQQKFKLKWGSGTHNLTIFFQITGDVINAIQD